MSQQDNSDGPVLALWLWSACDELVILFEVNGALHTKRMKYRRRTASPNTCPNACFADNPIPTDTKTIPLLRVARAVENVDGDITPSSRTKIQLESITYESDWSFIKDRRHDLDPYSPTLSTTSVLSDVDYMHNFA